MNLKNKRVLAFFAHPDDETLGMGGTLARLHREGAEVYVAIAATGAYARRSHKDEATLASEHQSLNQDAKIALALLGIPENHQFFGEFTDNEMDKHSLLELIHWLEKIMEEAKPDLLFTHHERCTNVDHQYCFNAAVVATRPFADKQISLITSEIPSSTGYLRPTKWEPNFYVELTEADVDKKIAAMESYKQEARKDPHPRSPEALKALAKVRGSESGYMWAEAFMIQRTFA